MAGTSAVRIADSDAAEAYRETGIRHFEKLLEQKPDAPEAAQAHYILGSFAAQDEHEESAKAHFERYLELSPEGPEAHEVRNFLSGLSAPK